MLVHSPRRLTAGLWLVALALLVLVLVRLRRPGGGPAGRAAEPPGQARTRAPRSTSTRCSKDPGAKDGQVVRVTGNFLADEGSAQLCALLMESYPPQCGGGVRLTGEVPADTLALLDTTKEPDLKKMWWGYVTVTGTFRASGANGQPVIELSEISLVEG